jgi:hypothetical protein
MAQRGPHDTRAVETRPTLQRWVKPLLWTVAVVVGIPAWAAVCFGAWWLLVALSGGPMFGR